MDIKWSYFIIAIIYLITILLKLIHTSQVKKLQQEHESLMSYRVYKKDFLLGITVTSLIITLFINGMAIFSGHSLNLQSLIITILLIGATYLSNKTLIYTIEEGVLFMDGVKMPLDIIEEVEYKEKQGMVCYTFSLKEVVNGYEIISFYLPKNNQEQFNTFIGK